MATPKKTTKRINDKENEKKPSLHISEMAYGKEKVGNLIKYLVDAKSKDSEKKISESVVLQRWQKRTLDGYTFSGSKLNPKVWRNLPLVLDGPPKSWVNLSVEMIKSSIAKKRSFMRERYISLPSANILKALFEICGSDRLSALVDRHIMIAAKKSMAPPIFSYMRSKSLLGKYLWQDLSKSKDPMRK